MEKSNPHKDHRQRLKTKVLNKGLDCLAEHEILELMLTYTIARKDTNPLAHELIRYFGSFAKTLEANYHDLLKIKGVGHETAFFLSVFPQLVEKYKNEKSIESVTVLKSPQECVKYFRSNFELKKKEYLLLVCLSNNKKVLKTNIYEGVSDSAIYLDINEILYNIENNGVKSILMYHTHPGGKVEPTDDDLKSTQQILNMCSLKGINLDDHIIINERTHFSFRGEGIIEQMTNNFNDFFKLEKLKFNYKKKE